MPTPLLASPTTPVPPKTEQQLRNNGKVNGDFSSNFLLGHGFIPFCSIIEVRDAII